MLISIIRSSTQELQLLLDQTFGTGIFTVVKTPTEFYLECADTTPQNLVDQGVEVSNNFAAELLSKTQVRLYGMLNTVANQTIGAKEKPTFSSEDVQLATQWYNDQTLPCPGCVIFISMRDSISTAQAAQNIINYETDFNNFVNQVNSIKINGQNSIMNSNDIIFIKSTFQTTRTEIENLL